MKVIYHGTSQASNDELINNLLHPPTSMIAVDTETVSVNDKTLIGIGVAINPHEAYYVPIFPEPSELLGPVMELLSRRDLFKVGHNYNFDIESLREFSDSYQYNSPDVWSIHDTAIMANVSGLPSGLHDLGNSILHNYDLFTIQELLEETRIATGKRNVTMLDADQEKVALKCCNDVRTTYGLFEKLIGQLGPKTYQCYEEDRFLTGVLKTIELKGLPIDEQEVNKRYTDLSLKLEVYEEWAEDLGFNIASNQQVGMFLAQNRINLPLTDSGKQLRVDEEALKRYRGHPLVDPILEFRKYQKEMGYVQRYHNKSRGFTHFRLDLATGRLASYDDNWQNWPDYLRAILDSDYGVFTWGDMSQLEMRVFAYLSQDTRLLQAYRDGISIHNITFSSFYPDKPRKIIDENGEEQDSPFYVKAKTGNFAMIFDAADGTIADQCEITIPEAKRFKQNWFSNFPEAREFMLRQQGSGSLVEETIFGRKMRIPLERGPHHAAKCRINFPVQGSGADMNKRSINKMWKMGYLNEDNFRIQVHDEVVMIGAHKNEFPHKELESIHDELVVPWEVKEGPKWH